MTPALDELRSQLEREAEQARWMLREQGLVDVHGKWVAPPKTGAKPARRTRRKVNYGPTR